MGPLDGVRVLEHEQGPAIGFAGLLLRMLGADVCVLEPDGGSPQLSYPPYHENSSMTHAYLAAGKQRRRQATLVAEELAGINVVLHEAELPSGVQASLEATPLPHAGRAFVRCTPYGASGPKSGWRASELSLFQAGGEGYLMPHGFSYEEHPERPPVGIGRYSAHYQGGIAAALAAVAALRVSRAIGRAEHVDVSIQDVELSLNYFSVSRYVDGVLETRKTRAFRFAGTLRCTDGYVELVPLEGHHWDGILKLLDHPVELTTSEFADPITRAAKGDVINVYLRRWARELTMAEAVAQATEAGVPCGPYLSPAQLSYDAQLAHRRFFISESDAPQRRELFPGPAWSFDRWEKPKLVRADLSGALNASA